MYLGLGPVKDAAIVGEGITELRKGEEVLANAGKAMRRRDASLVTELLRAGMDVPAVDAAVDGRGSHHYFHYLWEANGQAKGEIDDEGWKANGQVEGERSSERRDQRREVEGEWSGGRRMVRWKVNGQAKGDGDIDTWVSELKRRRFLGR